MPGVRWIRSRSMPCRDRNSCLKWQVRSYRWLTPAESHPRVGGYGRPARRAKERKHHLLYPRQPSILSTPPRHAEDIPLPFIPASGKDSLPGPTAGARRRVHALPSVLPAPVSHPRGIPTGHAGCRSRARDQEEHGRFDGRVGLGRVYG